MPDPKAPYPEPLPPEGGPTQYAPPTYLNPSPKQAPLSGVPVSSDTPQHLLPANSNPSYTPEENYVVPVLKKNLIRPHPGRVAFLFFTHTQ